MKPIISVKNLEITYNLGKENEFVASKDVNMEIFAGEYVAFFGPSGCGKSTLFYTILGILAPSAGEMLVDGENPYTYSSERMVHFQTRTIGIIYQAFYLINSISVIDNVALPQTFMGVSVGRRRKWAKQLLKRVGLETQGHKYPDNLSGGQNQRVSVARAMVNKPKIILADEPTGNLDSVSTKQVMDILEEINQKEKRTIILITHNAAQLSYCHRVFYMKDGKVLRTVANPDKKQIAKIDRQKTFVTEIDQLSKMHPYITPTELKVKSMVNFLTQDLNFDQLNRLETVVKLVIERKMEEEEFFRILSAKFRDGGVELTPQLSRIMADKVYTILKRSEDVTRYRRRFEQNTYFDRADQVLSRLTKYLVEEGRLKLTPAQLRLLKEAVIGRMTGLLKKEEFYQKLRNTPEMEGIGLKRQIARDVTTYFEKMIIQGQKLESMGGH